MDKILIIADDFTGANDTGVQLKKRGLNTKVVLEGNRIENDGYSYVLDTESRALMSDKAKQKIKNELISVDLNNYDLIYKKVDSTLRGNISAEIKAIDELYNPSIIIFAPSYPDIGRTTIDGIHLVNGKRITQTEFSKDPKKPVLEDRLKYIFTDYSIDDVEAHKLNELREGDLYLKHKHIHVFDIENNDDFKILLEKALTIDEKILWVGSAGLANELFKKLFPQKSAIAVVGSLSEVSKAQMRYANAKGVDIVKIDISKLLRNDDISNYVETIRNLIKENKDIIVTSSYDDEDYLNAIKTGEELSMSREDISYFTQQILSKIIINSIQNLDISGLFITGGDTAIEFIKATNASGSIIEEEVLTGIPMMKMCGGIYNGMKLITKAGAFGDENALIYSLEKIKEVKE
ncbi:MAG: four-carbon acid sugar kinase family protein [Tissierellales bacterium]|nr:four-carbon acid sugar kinase family protein [Tissierellales bacterium]